MYSQRNLANSVTLDCKGYVGANESFGTIAPMTEVWSTKILQYQQLVAIY
jgi:hypothetical protein